MNMYKTKIQSLSLQKKRDREKEKNQMEILEWKNTTVEIF